jgi:hypothetical protein
MMSTIQKMMAPQQRMEQLRTNRAYLQTDEAGRRRMEKAVSMGLPMNAVPEEWQPFGSRGITPYGSNMPAGYVRAASGWGSGWGSVGMDRMGGNNMSQPPPTGGGPQPEEGMDADIAGGVAPTLGGATSQMSSLLNPQIPTFPQTEEKEDNNPYSNERALARRRQRLGF